MITIHAQGEGSVNPTKESIVHTEDYRLHSHDIDLRFFQINAIINPCELDRVELKKSLLSTKEGPPAILKKLISDPERLSSSMEVAKLGAYGSVLIGPVTMLPNTKAVLLVALGEEWSGNSIRVIPVEKVSELGTSEIRRNVWVRKYDICIDRMCSETSTTVCPR